MKKTRITDLNGVLGAPWATGMEEKCNLGAVTIRTGNCFLEAKRGGTARGRRRANFGANG